MPDRMVEGQPLPRVENNPERIGEATGDEPPDAGHRQATDQRTEGEEDQPTHRQIEGGGNPVVLFSCPQGLDQDADDGEAPDGPEQPPTGGATQGDQGDGRVGTGDEQIDTGVIERLEMRLPPRGGEKVIERG